MKLPRLIGVIHLPPLIGSPLTSGHDPEQILAVAGEWAVKEARTLERLGYDGLILENFGDVPFYKSQVPPETVCAMGVIAAAVREVTRLPVGINVLRNDARSALAIAAVTGCAFFRVNVISGVAATDQGWIEGDAAFIARERARLGTSAALFADVHVKHARTFSTSDIGMAVEEAAHRAGASAVIVTGPGTGHAAELSQVRSAHAAARKAGVPLYIGSGVTPTTWGQLRPYADGVIVGSYLRKNGRAGALIDSKRASELVRAFKGGSKKAKKK